MSQYKSPVAAVTQLNLTTNCPSPGRVVVALAGEVDMATAPALHYALLEALITHTPVVLDVDLSACTFLDCSGIRVLVAVHATGQAAGCQVWARYPQRLVRLVLEVTKLLSRFTEPPAMTADATAVRGETDSTPAVPARPVTVPASVLASA